MRARLGLSISGVPVRVREVVLRDKPAEILALSPKGTVPVLQLEDGTVLDESYDIMEWALSQNDPEGWLDADPVATEFLVDRNDATFKRALDRYKYPSRYPEEGIMREDQRAKGLVILEDLNDRISRHGGQLLRPTRSLADMAIFPFVRQFAHVDLDWFNDQPLKPLQDWLEGHKQSDLFKGIMPKYKQWMPGGEEPKLARAI